MSGGRSYSTSVKTTINGLVEEVKMHQDNYQEVMRIFQNHEQYLVRNGAASEEMAQFINALIEDNQKERLWIENLVKESQAHTEVLRQHQMGQQVIAEVIKMMMAGQ